MAKPLIQLDPRQTANINSAVAKSQAVAFLVEPCPGAGFVWPHVTANGIPVSPVTPQQTAPARDALARGKTLAVTSDSSGRNHLGEN